MVLILIYFWGVIFIIISVSIAFIIFLLLLASFFKVFIDPSAVFGEYFYADFHEKFS